MSGTGAVILEVDLGAIIDGGARGGKGGGVRMSCMTVVV